MPITQRACPYCGLRIVFNDEERKASHQVPQCDGFAALVEHASARLKGKRSTFVEALDDEGKTVGRGKA
jgi:hypothetical protein